MSVVGLSLVLMLLLFLILGSGVWIAIALAVCGFAAVLTKVATPAGQVLATSMWTASNSWDLTALPMFIWMGEILYRTKLSDDMFEGLGPVAAETAGAPAARERDWLRHFRRCVRFIGRYLRHHRPHRAAGIAQARLRRTHGDRNARRLGDAWSAHSALDHHDCLCHRDRPVDRAAVHCRGHSGDRARRTVYGLHRGMGIVQSYAHAAARTAGPVSRTCLRVAAAYSGDAADPRRDRLDLWRAGVGDGSRCRRRIPGAGIKLVVRNADKARLRRTR